MKDQLDPILVRQSQKAVKASSPFSYYFGKLFFVPGRREILYVAYNYFRWLDDLLDSIDILRQRADEIITRQSTLIEGLYAGDNFPPQTCSEALIVQVVRCDRESGSLLRDMINGFVKSLSWDVQRRYSTVTQAELDSYSHWLGCSYSHGLLYGFGLDPRNPHYMVPGHLGGIASHLAHVLRDFEEDLQLGYINISKEDLENYGIDLRQRHQAAETDWKRRLGQKACVMFRESQSHRRMLPKPRARLAFDLMCARYYRIARKFTQLC